MFYICMTNSVKFSLQHFLLKLSLMSCFIKLSDIVHVLDCVEPMTTAELLGKGESIFATD